MAYFYGRSYGQVRPVFGARVVMNHPLAQGLYLCYPFNDPFSNVTVSRPGICNDAASGRYPLFWHGPSIQPGITFGGDSRGAAIHFGSVQANNEQGVFPVAGPQPALTAPYTVLMWITPQGNSGTYGGLISESGLKGFYVNTNKLDYFTSATDHYSNTTLTLNAPHLVGFSNVAGTATFWLDGHADGTATITDTTLTVNFFGSDTGNESLFGWLSSIFVWNGRALSAGEVAWLYQEPYAMFALPASRTVVPLGSGIPSPPQTSFSGTGLFVF
jgi:hypothetical protein